MILYSLADGLGVEVDSKRVVVAVTVVVIFRDDGKTLLKQNRPSRN